LNIPDNKPLDVGCSEAPEENVNDIEGDHSDDADAFSERPCAVPIVPDASAVLRLIRTGLSVPEFVVITLKPVEGLNSLGSAKHHPCVVLSLIPGLNTNSFIQVRDFACHILC